MRYIIFYYLIDVCLHTIGYEMTKKGLHVHARVQAGKFGCGKNDKLIKRCLTRRTAKFLGCSVPALGIRAFPLGIFL